MDGMMDCIKCWANRNAQDRIKMKAVIRLSTKKGADDKYSLDNFIEA